MPTQRQRQLISFIDAFGGEVEKYDLQKLLLLHTNEKQPPQYDFVPYRFGAFSFNSYADLLRMAEHGLVIEEEKSWRLSPSGRKEGEASKPLRQHLHEFAAANTSLRGESLIAATYRQFPYFAIFSEMAPRLLAGDKAALKAIEQARPPRQGPGLFTIGYEGRSLERYLNTLIQSGVSLLCDVRRNPLSRKYGFSKKTLSRACETVGIRYEHLRELGIPSEDRRDLKTQEDYDALFAVYEKRGLPKQRDAIERIGNWIAEGASVALTCYEALPHQCHRHCVAEEIQSVFADIQPPQHL